MCIQHIRDIFVDVLYKHVLLIAYFLDNMYIERIKNLTYKKTAVDCKLPSAQRSDDTQQL